ncbi:MAG: LEA type 2 family protein [Halolamina sp.]
MSLLGGKLKIVVAVVGLLAAAVGGGYAAGVVGAPSVESVENRFGPVGDQETVIVTDLTVDNPNPIGVSLGGLTVDYAVEMNGISMAEGTKEGVSVGTGNSTLSFETAMQNDRIPVWWVSHIRNGETTALTVSADVHSSLLDRSIEAPQVNKTIETDIVAAFNSTEDRPLNANKEPVVQDPVLVIRETSGRWGEVTNETTEIEMAFVVHNPNNYPITVSEIGYNITMNDLDMGQGATDSGVVIPPGGTETVRATTELNTPKLDEWWVTHLQNDQVTNMTVSFTMKLDLSEGGGNMVTVPAGEMTKTIETDLFGTKGEPSGGAESDGTGSDESTPTDGDDGGEGTATDGDGGTSTPTETPSGETETPTDGGTDTPSETPSPTPTPTDDGILG